MNIGMSKNEALLAVRKLSFSRFDSLPLSFRLGERVIRGIPRDFHPTLRKRLMDSNIVETTIEGEKDGLSIRAEVKQYHDYPITEYTVYFTNHGTEPTEILSEINAIDADFCGESPVLQYGNGDNGTVNSYQFFDYPLTGDPFLLQTDATGMSCSSAFPFWRVKFDDHILTMVLGWGGGWQATFTSNPLGINVRAGQKRCHFRINPGETMRTPLILCMISEGDCEDRAINLWRHFYFDHVLPKQWGENIGPKICAHVWNYRGEEFTGATEDSQIQGIKKFVRRGVTPDIWWYDAGFYPCDGRWNVVGSWHEDYKRFPNNGLRPVAEECDKHGIDLLVWFEPERASRGSEIDRLHPEYLLPVKNADGTESPEKTFILYDMGNVEAREWITNRVDTLIKKWKIKVYRQDCNLSPGFPWSTNETEDRQGAMENLHIQGLYRYWDDLLMNNPGLVFDNCAGGGRRNDLETLRRGVPLHYTDVGIWEPSEKVKQILNLFEWIPLFRAHTYSKEPQMNPAAFFINWAPCLTLSTAAWSGEAEFEVVRAMLPIWRKAAEIMLCGDYYRQMKVTYGAEMTDFICQHFYDSTSGKGFVMFLRNRECEKESFEAILHLEEGFDYEVENPLTGEKYIAPASELKTLAASPAKGEGIVFFFTRVK